MDGTTVVPDIAPSAPPVATQATPATGSVPTNTQDSWSAAAQSPAAAQPASSPQMPTQATPSNATVPSEAAPPLVLTPNKPGGLAGVIDGMLNVLTGKTKPETATASDGSTYVKQTSLTHGEQWMRVADEALHGAGAGMVAGKGRNAGAALAAGVGAGDQINQQRQQQQKDAQGQADKSNAQARQAKLDQYNFVHLQQRNAAEAFTLKQAGVKAGRDDIDFAQKQDAMYKSEGYEDMGVSKDPAHLADNHQDDPNFWKDVYARNIVQNKEYDADGNVVGVRLWRAGAETNLDQPAPKGAALTTWQPPAKPGEEGQFVYTPTSGDYTKQQLQTYAAKAESDRDAYVLKQQQAAKAAADVAHTQAETGAERATASEVPSVIGKNRAEAANATAEAAEHTATANKTNQTTNDAPLVDEIGSGKMVPERLSYLLSRNPALLQEVAAKYPGFDSSKAEAYPKVYSEFTSSKPNTAGGALNAGATAMEHLKKLADLNTVKSHFYGTAAYNAYHNQLDTLAPELAKFYGDTTIPAIEALKSTLGATLPGNRHAAIATQAQSMGKKFDNYEQTWRNAAPSAAYEAPMPGVSQEAMEARAALDPSYRARAVQTQQPQHAPAGSLVGPIQTGEHMSPGPNGPIVWRGGKWVNPQTGQAVQ